jgi:hypothetical protein
MGSIRIVLSVLLKTAFVLATAFELLGCAAPVAVTVASFAADGASLAVSGKTMSDHALSMVSGENCSTAGLLDDGVLCRERLAEPDLVVANEAPPLAAPPAPAPRPAPADNSAATFLALGAFADWENADHAVVQGRFYNPLVVPIENDAKAVSTKATEADAKPAVPAGAAYWVVAGRPLAGGDGAVPIAQAKSIGFADARTIVLCRATYRPGPCVTEDEPDVTAAVDAKVQAARRPDTSVAERVEPDAAGPPERLY